MKRIQVRPGKIVTISPALAEKAAAVFANGVKTWATAEPGILANAPFSSG